MELAPGAGRFSVELARLSREMVLVDLNQACIEICRERFKYYPNFRFYTDDGSSLDVVEDDDFDLIATFDSMVHLAPEIVESYLRHFDTKVKPGGLSWMDHSGRGEKEVGKRTAVTADFVVAIAKDLGLIVDARHFRNDHDCVSVFRRR